MADAQTQDGLIPSTVPEYTSLPGAYRNDANWGGRVRPRPRVPVHQQRGSPPLGRAEALALDMGA